MSGAVLFDVDGTLVDSNYQHVVAWVEAFREAGHTVTGVEVHQAIGRGSGDLVSHLIGHEDEAIVEDHSARWAVARKHLQALPGASDLIRACHAQGLRVVWATSGSEDDVAAAKRVLDVDDCLHAVVSSADAEQSKPSPDVIELALEAAGVPPERAVMVGDTVYDVRAARSAGVACISLLAGGIGEALLRAEHPAGLYSGCPELLDQLTVSPLAVLL